MAEITEKSKSKTKTDVINGSIQSGDWIITAPPGVYGCLIGQVVEVIPFCSPKHESGSLTDDVRIDFTAYGFSYERKAEILENFDNYGSTAIHFDDLPLRGVIMAPQSLINIMHLDNVEVNILNGSYERMEEFCKHIKNPQYENYMNSKTANTLYGDVKPGDWVFAAPTSEYGYLIGKVKAIDKLGTPEHRSGNETDDVHVDFTVFDYSPERVSEIEAHFGHMAGEAKHFCELSLDDVTMSPLALISIMDIGRDEIIRLGNQQEYGKIFCNSFTFGITPQNEKHAILTVRLDKNYTDYRNSLLNFGKLEIFDKGDEIAAMTEVYLYLTTHHKFSEVELDCLLRFTNPLEVVAAAWKPRRDDIGDLEVMLNDAIRGRDVAQSEVQPVHHAFSKALNAYVESNPGITSPAVIPMTEMMERVETRHAPGDTEPGKINEKIALAMSAGARAIEQNKKCHGATYVYDVFGAKKELSYYEAARLLREVAEPVLTKAERIESNPTTIPPAVIPKRSVEDRLRAAKENVKNQPTPANPGDPHKKRDATGIE
jgi:hypothetical protein